MKFLLHFSHITIHLHEGRFLNTHESVFLTLPVATKFDTILYFYKVYLFLYFYESIRIADISI